MQENSAESFETSDEYVIRWSGRRGSMMMCKREQDFIGRLVSGIPEPGSGGVYPAKFRREDIAKAMRSAGLVKNPNSLFGKIQVWKNLRRVHRTYWRDYSFLKLTGGSSDSVVYKVRLDNFSG